ncbi:MAG: hypothetical protein JNK51_00660 [Blastocatellia bacterium]|nr:hypothetical protein [Blastocatellia bacterium]
MKQIFQNRFLRSMQFSNSREELAFLNQVPVERVLSIDLDDGQNPICYIGYDSLTQDIEFVLSFRSESNEEDLNLIFWQDRIVFDTGRSVFFVSYELELKASLELTTPLIGFHLVSDNELLILEEAFMRVVNKNGLVLKSESFDLVTRTTFEKNRLVLQTESGQRTLYLDPPA